MNPEERNSMEAYTWDKEQKRIVDPAGKSLTIQELLVQLNEMYKALTDCHLAWRVGNDMMLVLDNVFLGAYKPEEVPEEEVLEEVKEEEEKK